MANFKKKFSCVIFDFDGTLVMTMHALTTAYKRAFLKRGHLIRDHQIAELIFGDWKDGVSKLGIENKNRIFQEVVEEAHLYIAEAKLYPRVYESLKKLNTNGVKIGVCSLTESNYINSLLRSHDIQKFFSSIVTGDDVFDPKPNPNIIKASLAKLNANQSETIYIGNSISDVTTARAASVASGIYYPEENTNFHKLEDYESMNPDYIFYSFEEVLSVTS